ncbi:hypothetical protein, partial [Deinococcus alpinitundrae]|uniref:hypothetical protein n=1 Tax=Deinococcus alpinitundrae TaxID=468913 RepID=UPI001ED951F6
VEHYLAKVDVARSNRVSRSKVENGPEPMFGASLYWSLPQTACPTHQACYKLQKRLLVAEGNGPELAFLTDLDQQSLGDRALNVQGIAPGFVKYLFGL